jgi:hypothetical protein
VSRMKSTKNHTADAFGHKTINYSNSKSKNKIGRSGSISFRLTHNILYKLRQEAKQKEISVDTLMTQIAKQHTDWYVNAGQIGFISVRKSLIIKLLDEIRDDRKIKEIARDVAKGSSGYLLSLKEQSYIPIESALDFIEIWIKEAGYAYIHDISGVNRNIHHFVIHQDMGLKWSLYLSEIFRNLFEELFNATEIFFDITDNLVEFTLDTGEDGGK